MNTSAVSPEASARESGQDTDLPFSSASERAVLRRPFQGRMVTGVAVGLARYAGVDVMFVRIALVVLTLFSGAGIPLYLAGLLLIPEEGSGQSIARSLIESLWSRLR